MATDDEVTGQQFERTEEFDAFGPWVLPVRTEADVPRLFRQHLSDPATATVVLKVPRRISRRDANPRMDLYDHLVEVRGDVLTVLTRAPGDSGGVRRRVLRSDQLIAVEESVDLLDGRIVVRALDEPALTVRYNGASRDTVAALVTAVRRLWRTAPAEPVAAADSHPVPLGLRDLGPDVALVSEYREVVAAEPGMTLRGAHTRRVVSPTGSGALAGALHRLWPMWLQGAVVCSDGVELQVLHRRSWWVRGNRPVHSLARTVLPLERNRAVQVLPTGYLGVEEVRVHGGAATFAVPAAAPTHAALVEALRG